MTKAELVRRIEKAEAIARGAGHDWFGLLSERDALKERLEKCEQIIAACDRCRGLVEKND